MLKNYLYVLFACLLLIGFIFFYHATSGYTTDEQLAGFPIPTAAELDKETDYSKHFHWTGVTGTELKLTYLLAIKLAGWERMPVDGQMMQFKNNEVVITVIPSTDYLEILIEQ